MKMIPTLTTTMVQAVQTIHPIRALRQGFSVAVGETAMICITRNLSTVTWYKNGVFRNSSANAYGALVTGTSPISLGLGYTSNSFGGSLYAVQVYNKCLTAAEVMQNFNVHRGRYGI
jgi:hypothetical protein